MLERTTPEAVGISSNQVEKCINALMHEKTQMNGFMALRHGKVFAECWWTPYSPELPHSNHSLGKSYTATAIGIGLKEGILSLDEHIVDIFAEEVKKSGVELTDNLKAITIENVLTMTNGMARHPIMTADWIGDYLREEVVYKPGTYFLYNTSGTCLLSAIITKKTGETLEAYLKKRLFPKIGIDSERFAWLKFKDGYSTPPGTFSTTEDNLRLGMLYLNKGRWNGEQIVSEEFITKAMSVQIDTSGSPGVKDCCCGYGYQLWACSMPGVFRFDGGQGQYVLIWPDKDLLVAVHEGGFGPDGPQITLDVLYEELLGKISDETLPNDMVAYEKLLAYEASMKLPKDEPNTLNVDAKVFEGHYEVTEGNADPWIEVAPSGINFFALFQEKNRKSKMTEFDLSIQPEKCILTVDEYAVFEAYFDGDFRMVDTDNVFPQIGKTCSTARYINETTLEITIHWMYGWFVNIITLNKNNEEVDITIRKVRLQADYNYMEYHSRALRK